MSLSGASKLRPPNPAINREIDFAISPDGGETLLGWIGKLVRLAYEKRMLRTKRIWVPPSVYRDLLVELAGYAHHSHRGAAPTEITYHTATGPVEILEGSDYAWEYERGEF